MPRKNRMDSVTYKIAVMTQITDNNLPSIANPKTVMAFATELQEFVRTQGLTTNIHGKQFVNVEGWQFAGSQLGLIAVVTGTRDLSKEGELKYEASAKIINLHTDKEV